MRHELVEGRQTLTDLQDSGRLLLVEDHLELDDVSRDTLSLQSENPLSFQVQCERTSCIGRGDWQTRAEASCTMSATSKSFLVSTTLKVYEDNIRIFSRSWDLQLPRDLV